MSQRHMRDQFSEYMTFLYNFSKEIKHFIKTISQYLQSHRLPRNA